MKQLIVLTLFVAGAAGGGYWYWNRPNDTDIVFRTAPVMRGELVAAISSTGTVEPEEVVDVGAQVAGRIEEFGKDADGKTIDYGSRVEPGIMLAKIDDALYREEMNQARSMLAKAKARLDQAHTQVQEGLANVERAEADLLQVQTKFHQADRDWQRAKQLVSSSVVSQQEYDTVESAYETARATVAVADAAIVQAKSGVDTRRAAVTEAEADVESAQAQLNRGVKNFDYTTIRSPITGVIIDRRVNIGQTVLASLSAPSLFLIAKDLRRIQVWASVNEADIGHVRPGQTVRFTIDAFPGETFLGSVGQIRLNASMLQNVVTYTVVVNADNSDGRLLPYLTANLQFEVSRTADALMVPNAALRWQPPSSQVDPTAPRVPERLGEQQAVVWIVGDAGVRPIVVGVGVSDGVSTEIVTSELSETAEVVIGEQRREASDYVNPLMPLSRRSGG